MAIANSPAALGQPLPNQTAPLQLHDIHVPEQVSNFPIAPGWWLLLAIILLSVVWFYKKFKQQRSLNANKNRALAMLANNQNLSEKECISLLKCTAMQYFSRQQLAKLYGTDFKDFLMKQLPVNHQEYFSKLITPAFVRQYQAEQGLNSSSDSDCQQATKLWLTNALPIRQPLAIKIALPVDKPLPVNKAIPVPRPVEKEQELSA
ncbi:DUF4381 domain-containing protein [Colwellia psychrerythraea]|uniref:DUF4381 domain-containing protein n=1 Tax=Colwellia psychrerythraea TaxID=28229 RepID=A0A099KBG0_COLPS|nr:DUF4381 domain-containing protein [Colwellia psychrerythraea]KGJ87412.1 hypothetical protein GAB14E_4567 [Colwellia psychrerythraea]